MTTDKSKLEISAQDIQDYYDGKSINFADIESFVSGQVSNTSNSNNNRQRSPNIANNSGFYISQDDYIEYQIAKREAIKKSLRKDKVNDNLWRAFLWFLRVLISIILTCSICYGFYMLCWLLQQTF